MVYEIEFKERGLAFAAYNSVREHYRVRGLPSRARIIGRTITFPNGNLSTIENLLKKHQGRYKLRD